MRVLLDHCVPRPLTKLLAGHDARTAKSMNWQSLANGKLLAEAAVHFDVFLTIDKNLAQQQDRGSVPLPVVVLLARNNTIETVSDLVPDLLKLLGQPLQKRIHFVPAQA